MKDINKIYKVIEYTDEDLKDTDKYNEYTETLSDLIDMIEDTPMVKTLMDTFFDEHLIDQLDELLVHADEVYSKSQEKAKQATKQALDGTKKFSIDDLVNDYLKQSEISKSFSKPVHYYQAYHLLSDFAEFVINK